MENRGSIKALSAARKLNKAMGGGATRALDASDDDEDGLGTGGDSSRDDMLPSFKRRVLSAKSRGFKFKGEWTGCGRAFGTSGGP